MSLLQLVPLVLVLLIHRSPVDAAVPMPRYEAMLKQQSLALGLYNSTDKVVILGNGNFKETVLQQNHSSLVEFYNSYCGHCKRFAPFYKLLATRVYPWRDVLQICAIDCADEENNDICREYEVMQYPTLRYLGPGFVPSEKNYGYEIKDQDIDTIRTTLARLVAAENRTSKMTAWPKLNHLTHGDTKSLFDGLDKQRKHVVVVYEPENTTAGIETILQYTRYPAIHVRRVTDLEIASKFELDGVTTKVATVDRSGAFTPHEVQGNSTDAYFQAIDKFLHKEHITELPEVTERTTTLSANEEETRKTAALKLEELIAEVLRNKHFVYQADLEMAIHAILHNEVPKVANITGERLLAVQRFLAVLERYNPLGPKGRAMIKQLYQFTMHFNQQMSGKEFEDELVRLESQHTPVYSASKYVGCASTQSRLRGFTCSVWKLFHYFTVQATRSEISQDPLEVLQVMHGYVKYFFGCTECAGHFQSMASRRKIWSTPNKDEAVLWLWAAHNEVNNRLAGDSTEDPQFPKKQFPRQTSCSQCYRETNMSPATLDINWDKTAVLNFLKNIYNPEYISRYGVDEEHILDPAAEQLRQKRLIGSVFTDMDMRMGMLLYGFCIIMMVAAFKLFAYKGYRRKPYSHDMLGKV